MMTFVKTDADGIRVRDCTYEGRSLSALRAAISGFLVLEGVGVEKRRRRKERPRLNFQIYRETKYIWLLILKIQVYVK
jgi:hypothetical protein